MFGRSATRLQLTAVGRFAVGALVAGVALTGCGGDGEDVAASSGNDAASGSAPIVVGVDPKFPPDNFLTPEGDYVGWETEIMQAIGEELGRTVEFQSTTFDALIPGLQAGRFDVVLGNLGITPERLEVVDFVSISAPDQAFLARADSGLDIQDLDDLCGKVLAVTRGSTQETLANEQQPQCDESGLPPIELQVYQSGDENILAVESGRADLYWTSQSRGVHYSTTEGTSLMIAGWNETSAITGIALQQDTSLTEDVHEAVGTIMDNGKYEQILAEWGMERAAIESAEINPAA